MRQTYAAKAAAATTADGKFGKGSTNRQGASQKKPKLELTTTGVHQHDALFLSYDMCASWVPSGFSTAQHCSELF